MNALAKPMKAQRCDLYLAWVRTQPSVISSQYGCEAHHVIGDRYSTLKTSDFLAIPLLPWEHALLHGGWREWEAKYGGQREYSWQLQDLAHRYGLISHVDISDCALIVPNRKLLKRAAASWEESL